MVVLHGDVVDYSRHLADDPIGTIATVEAFRDIVRSRVESCGGTLVDFVGDAFLATFEEAREAIAAAVAVCSEVRAGSGPVPLLFRMGLSSGEVMTLPDGRVFGDPVTIAARIQAITERGGINVSEGVFRELDEPALRLRPLGPHRLKNVPEPVRVYVLEAADGPVAPRPAVTSDPTIAVLPVNGPDEIRSSADAIRLDLVTALVNIPGLDVIDVPDRGGDPDPGRVRLTARYVLESGIHRSGDRVRVYVQLLDSATVNRIWASRWEGGTDELFELQDHITRDVVRAMEIELVVGEPASLYRSLVAPTSLDRVYRGWHQLAKGDVTGLRNAIALFESIAVTDPGVASGPALAAFAHWYGALSGLSDTPEADLAMARSHSARGIELDDPTGLSQMVKAALVLHDGGDLHEALADARRALELRPTCDVTFGVEASIHRYLGDWEAAVESSRRAIAMSPTPKPWYETTLAGAYYAGRRYQEAADTAELVIDTKGNLEAWLLLAAAQQALGLERRAAASVEAVRARYPAARRTELRRAHPFREPEVLDRWMAHLARAGMP
jgi:class 3 adenylate cyclase/tetratricopeptide (TPR) repeat protein